MRRSILVLVFVLGIAFASFAIGEKGEAVKTGKRSIDMCMSCHADSKIDFKDKFAKAYTNWLEGPHGNFNYYDDKTRVKYRYSDFLANFTYSNEYAKFVGFPDEDYIAESLTSPEYTNRTKDYCLGCHGPSSADEQKISQLPLINKMGRLDLENARQTARPVIGCENCHSGRIHDLDPNYKKPSAAQCGQCHNKNLPEEHLKYRPNAAGGAGNPGVFEAYSASPHAAFIPVYDNATGKEVKAICSRCHTDEGAKVYKDIAGGYENLVRIFEGKPNLKEFSAVQCSTCHNAHNPEIHLWDATPGSSDQFNTCTNCHQLLEGANKLVAAYHDPKVNPPPYGSEEKIITDTHFDDPATDNIEGYVIDKASNIACTVCHNPHSANLAINRQWAESTHGGKIAEVKKQERGAVTEEEAPAWVHYDFKNTSERAACQRCHTSTGFKNFASSPATYKPEDNVFTAAGKQKEMLYCWACHTDYSGTLRNPGKFNQTAPYSAPKARIEAVPDLNGSNICLACHSGRESGQKIKDVQKIAGVNFGTFNSHYLAAGGVLFRTIGYEYDGKDYENPLEFRHDNIGANGACISCHMGTSENHLFSPVKKDAAGRIIEITANKEVCSYCHPLTTEKLNEGREGYEAALDALKKQLGINGIYYGSAYPYFYTTPNPRAGLADAFTDWTRDTLGAAFNLNMLVNEPGAYVHNRYYAKRLIFDSIDYLDNGKLDGIVDLSGYPPAAEWHQGDKNTANDNAVSRR